ncbi:MAG: protein kinase [Chitinivibrionales bacterium]|nr:protein kinase [Chitinivibrionales bacterium]MBD3394457.1 protein kinase [Chitinivibrionales bacterium]
MPKKILHKQAATPVTRLDQDKVKIHNILDKMERTFLPVGAPIGKYRIIEEIDRGGMAVVYKATQLDLDRVVALKVLPANVTINRQFVERFLSEAHAVARLNHPNIVSIHEVSMQNNIYFLAMDYVPGTNLFHFMNRKKPKLVDVLEIFVQLADALAYAHDQRILHRDLKLNNVIMRDNRLPVLIDFGLAKAMEGEEDGLTKTGEIMGSPAYMAPERILGGGSDMRSDVCSLGIMLYEVLTLKNPYLDPRSIHQTTMNVIEANPVQPRKLVPWLPSEVEAITLKAMHREPEKRYQTMAAFRDDLLRYQRGEQVLANPPSFWSKLRHRARKRWPVIAIVLTALVFAGVLGAVLHLQRKREQRNWRLIAEEPFEQYPRSSWYVYDGGDTTHPAAWTVKNGALQVASRGYTYLRLERFFTRDLRFEFDIAAAAGAVRDIGFFICGNDPDGGYRFHIHHGAGSENGITYPGSSFLFSDCDPMTFPAGRSYHAVAEKVDNAISFRLNGVEVAKIHDFFPPYGKDHQKVGFFVNGGWYRIDNLRVYRLAMPELASPTIIADRFWEHGDFYAALDEYEELLLDVSREDIVHTVKLRMADCLIRLNDFDAADAILSEEHVASAKNESRLAHVLYLKGMLSERRGDFVKADEYYFDLAKRFPSSAINQSVAARLVLRAVAALEQDTAGRPEERIARLTRLYPKSSRACGRAHLRVLEYYINKGMLERASAVVKQVLALHPRSVGLQAAARHRLALMYLGRRKQAQAVGILNQAVTTQEPAREVWRAWLTLAGIYEHDRNYGDAVTVYRKIHDECPPTVPEHWYARIKLGEIAKTASLDEDPAAIFASVAKSSHPFALPRIVGQFYAGMLPEEHFEEEWEMLAPGDPRYRYHLARKDFMTDSVKAALRHLEDYLAELSPDSWEYVKAYALLERYTPAKPAASGEEENLF